MVLCFNHPLKGLSGRRDHSPKSPDHTNSRTPPSSNTPPECLERSHRRIWAVPCGDRRERPHPHTLLSAQPVAPAGNASPRASPLPTCPLRAL